MLSAGNGFIMQSEKYSRDNAGQSLKKYTLLKKGELAYNHGASKAKQFGCCYQLEVDEALVPFVYHCFSVNKEYAPYISTVLNISTTERQLKRLVSSSVRMDGLLNISYDDYMTVELTLPSMDEQQKVSCFLSLLEEKIKKQQQLVEHLKKYKRGAITLILSNKDAYWKSGRLGDFITINRGGSPRPIEAFITNDLDGVNWVKIGDVSEDSLYITQTAEKITAEGSRKSRKVFAGDLILSNSMSFGRPYIMQIEGCIHDGWLLLRDDGACFDKKYLCYYLASDEVLAQYKKYAAGSCVSNLNSELVSNVFIEFPPLEKQKEIASSLELLDERINCEIKLLDKLLLIKKGLLQSLFI